MITTYSLECNITSRHYVTNGKESDTQEYKVFTLMILITLYDCADCQGEWMTKFDVGTFVYINSNSNDIQKRQTHSLANDYIPQIN